MTFEELEEKYGFKELTIIDGRVTLNPIYKKWLPATWVIDNIYAHQQAGNISLSKARELTAATIEEHLKTL
jgi:hypothetical protein